MSFTAECARLRQVEIDAQEKAFEEEMMRLEEEAACEAEREAERKRLEEEQQVMRRKEEERLIEESIVKAKADALQKLAEEEKERNQQRVQALQELQECRDRAAHAALRQTSDQASREPSGSKQKIYKSASMIRDTPEVERLVLKRKCAVSLIGGAPDPDDDPTPGDNDNDNDDDDDEDDDYDNNNPPPMPLHNHEACLRCVIQAWKASYPGLSSLSSATTAV
ncbi:hypothetical protein J3R30DRAFT_3408585 [Lentinula aciculospora]|uniref:Uncharacterized protein n=1 Tax=Lentinula aciculospora TaxID=153920 RepID=A0A9W8ZYQ8_9AGAR|nr:hypothetical protein J3R30DRAFT_3408585 [Lentinula aciculospora]